MSKVIVVYIVHAYFIYSRLIWLDLRKCQNSRKFLLLLPKWRNEKYRCIWQEDEWMVKATMVSKSIKIENQTWTLFASNPWVGLRLLGTLKWVGCLKSTPVGHTCGVFFYCPCLFRLWIEDVLSFVLFCMMMRLTTSFAMPLFFSCHSYMSCQY